MIEFIRSVAEPFYAELLLVLGGTLVVLTLAIILLRFRSKHHRNVAQLSKVEAQKAVGDAQQQIDAQLAEIQQESQRVRTHYENEARRVQAEADNKVRRLTAELEPLRKYQSVTGRGIEVQHLLEEALREASSLRDQAKALMEGARAAGAEERSKATQKAKEVFQKADAILDRATRDAGRIVEEAHKQAEKIGGDAYLSLREKDALERAVIAIRNVIDGYGDRYVIPTRSLIDDLASDFGHTEAGQTLLAARDQSKRMVEEGQAATCDYVEANRRETAIRFVLDAFNGRVDAILTRARHDNFGTLEQEIRDAFALVNLNGRAFRDASILESYLAARIAELKWAVVVHELRVKEREEQRRIKEQMREEEKARREYERAIQEAQKEEEIILRAMERARLEAATASAEQKAEFEAKLSELGQKLAEAEAKNQRAMSMAQQTRKGNVYIISNMGSFGDEVFKIGMTRRLEPLDRVRELGDASVPFSFDVHAIVFSDDAPALEKILHSEFDAFRINKVNYRKEFFRMPIDKLREFFATRDIKASFTMTAEAHEYRETQALIKMTPERRERLHLSHSDGDTWED